ncbi:MAG: hypothetical protein R3F29_00130 [Planctomycetota bacterium]
MVTLIVTIAAALIALIGEALHGMRVAKVRHLVFGHGGAPAPWARAVPALRWASLTGMAWALVTLMQVEPKVHAGEQMRDEDWRHLILVYDVSPSMYLKDAGAAGDQTRHERARDLIESLFDRVQIGKFKVSVIATYNGALPVVIDTKDVELVRHMLTDVNLGYAFKVGKTKLFDGIEQACELAKPWRIGSTLLVVVSDGDSVPSTGMPELPPSISGSLVVGVGDSLSGKFIDGGNSRQDESTLRQIAIRMGGEFHNGNRRQVPSDILSAASQDARKPLIEQLSLREYALLVLAVASSLLGLLPVLLHHFGTRWRPGVRVFADAA